jgi:hypothetical protein
VFCGLKQIEDFFFRGDVCMNGKRTAPTRNDLISHNPGLTLAGAEVDGNRVSTRTRKPSDRRANSAASAGDNEGPHCFGSCLSVQENLSTTNDTKEARDFYAFTISRLPCSISTTAS